MEGTGDELLPGSTLTADQHGNVGVGDARDQVANLAHLLARAEQLTGGSGVAGVRPRRR